MTCLKTSNFEDFSMFHCSLIIPCDAVGCWLKIQGGGKHNHRKGVSGGQSTLVVWVTDGGEEEEKEEREEEREEEEQRE